MGSKTRSFLLLLMMSLVVSGCYNKPVRHLVSDVALLKVGESTQEDVLVFLGDPDEQEVLSDGSQKWRYSDKDTSLIQKTPMVGTYFGAPEYQQLVVTIKNGIVTECVFSASDEDDTDWVDDYSWQEEKEKKK
jgi:hypothetical protein